MTKVSPPPPIFSPLYTVPSGRPLKLGPGLPKVGHSILTIYLVFLPAKRVGRNVFDYFATLSPPPPRNRVACQLVPHLGLPNIFALKKQLLPHFAREKEKNCFWGRESEQKTLPHHHPLLPQLNSKLTTGIF